MRPDSLLEAKGAQGAGVSPRRVLFASLLLWLAGSVLVAPLACRRAEAPAPSAAPAPPPRAPNDFEPVVVIFDGKFGDGWQDWGWGRHEYPAGKPAQISFGDYGGIILHHDELPSEFGGVAFRYKTPKDYGNFLQISLKYQQLDEKALPKVAVEPTHVRKLPDGWNEVLVPWSALNPGGSRFDRIMIHARLPVPADLVDLDHIVLTKPSAAAKPKVGPPRKISLAAFCDRPATRINPLIYGIANDAWDTGATAKRFGGNTSTRLNWELGAWNTGSDWYFENVSGDGTSLFDWVDAVAKQGVSSAVTVPIIGWVVKDKTSVGFPVSKFGKQRAHDPYRAEAGDGAGPDGKPIAPGPPGQTSLPAPPELIQKWIEKLVERDKARGKRGVHMYILDNEPMLWNTTHRDVHPEPLDYDGLLDRAIRYGTVIRKADPEAVIAGPAEWGWSSYFFSAKDLTSALRTDRLSHGNVPLLAWYLRKLAEHEKRTGVRILDVVDVHFYPQASGVWGNNAGTDATTSALRLRSTRAFWDPTYKDESWIDDQVRLIPRLKEWIAENYPGRGISIGEWNFGAEAHMSGGLAVAEVLGRFGQQGITSAFYWVGPPPGTPAFFAFRAFRNYDGKGAKFHDWSVPTLEDPNVSFFVSRDDARSRLTAVLVNKDPLSPAVASIDVSSCGALLSRRAFAYEGAATGFVEEPKADGQAISEQIAPYSIKVIELTISKPTTP